MARLPRAAGQGERLGQVVAANLRGHRRLRDLSQRDLGQQMRALGHEWSQVTVSEVERGRRSVTVDELAGLAVAIGVTPVELLDPAGVDGSRTTEVSYGAPEPLGHQVATSWLRGLTRLRAWVDADGRWHFRASPAPVPAARSEVEP